MQEQLTLLNRLIERLTETISSVSRFSKTQRMRNAAAILREYDLAAEAFTRKTNSAETIRRLREKKHR